MLGCEIPLTPDQGEARDWLLEELAKGVYGEISGPIVSFVSDLIDGFFDLLSWRGEGTPPISLILTILAIIAIAALIVVLILHPIRLAKRRSGSVFEEETSTPRFGPRSTRPWPPRIGTSRTCGPTVSWSWASTTTTSSPRPRA